MENIDFDRLRELLYGDNTYSVDSLNDLYETTRCYDSTPGIPLTRYEILHVCSTS